MNNADHIKSLIENSAFPELANLLKRRSWCKGCTYEDSPEYCLLCSCTPKIKEWLKSEMK